HAVTRSSSRRAPSEGEITGEGSALTPQRGRHIHRSGRRCGIELDIQKGTGMGRRTAKESALSTKWRPPGSAQREITDDNRRLGGTRLGRTGGSARATLWHRRGNSWAPSRAGEAYPSRPARTSACLARAARRRLARLDAQ